LTRESLAASKGLKPLARILGYTSFAREPEWFTLAPVGAIQKLLAQLNWLAKDVDLYEINEAFAAVPMAAMKDLSLDHAKSERQRGACALGHPIGATGARILTTLLFALKARARSAASPASASAEAKPPRSPSNSCEYRHAGHARDFRRRRAPHAQSPG